MNETIKCLVIRPGASKGEVVEIPCLGVKNRDAERFYLGMHPHDFAYSFCLSSEFTDATGIIIDQTQEGFNPSTHLLNDLANHIVGNETPDVDAEFFPVCGNMIIVGMFGVDDDIDTDCPQRLIEKYT